MAEPTDKEAAESEDDFLALVRERYKRCIEAETDNRDRAREALKFRDLDQWDEFTRNERTNDPEGARPCLVVDKLNQHVNQVVNDERQNRPQIKVRPVEGGDVEVAKVYDGLMRHIQDRSHADIAYDTGFEAAVDGGFGYWRILTEYADPLSFDQDIMIARIRNRFSVYLDPEHQQPDGSDAKYGFILYKVSRKEFKREFGASADDALGGFAAEGREFIEWYGEDWVVYAEYYWREVKKERICLLSNGEVVRAADYDDAALEASGLSKEAERETETCTIRWRKLTATKILDEGGIVFDSIPIIEVVGNELDIEGCIKRSGMIRSAMDAQRVDNYATSAFVEQVALAPRASWVAALGQIEGNEEAWRTANRRNISTLTYKPIEVNGIIVGAPQRQAPPGISPGWLAVMEQSEHNIQASMGRYNATLGAPSNETSGRAIQARNREGDIGSFHFSDNLARSIRHTGQMIVNAIPKVYSKRRIARIIGEDGTPSTVTLDPSLADEAGNPVPFREVQGEGGAIEKVYNLGVGKYDVTVTTGPGYTTRRLESADAMMEISRGNPEFLQRFGDIIFKAQDWPGADLIGERFKKMLPPELQEQENAKGDKAKIARAQQQVQAAAQALGQREAQMQAHAEALAAAAQEADQKTDQAQAMEQKAKEALRKVEAEVDKLNVADAQLRSERELFAMQQKLAQKEIEISQTGLKAEREVLEADVKTIKANMESKLAEINAATDKLATEERAQDKTSSIVADINERLDRVEQLASAERELILDADGEPIGSRPKLQAVQ